MLIHRIFYVHHTIELLRNVKQGMKLVYSKTFRVELH